MSIPENPPIAMRFEGGPYDGMKLIWPEDAASCPTAITFEDHRYDQTFEDNVSLEDMANTAISMKYLGSRIHRYEIDGMLIPLGGEELWNFRYKGSKHGEKERNTTT